MGAGLLAKRASASTSFLPDTPLSRASPLPQGNCIHSTGLLAKTIQQAKQVFARSIKRRGTS
ncbi:hypothetical protein C1X65_12620 [Pseudomonas sp. FW305-70]|nr:hypothetical protein C1X65_12620 [Pseudomonas sp. FW305-70]